MPLIGGSDDEPGNARTTSAIVADGLRRDIFRQVVKAGDRLRQDAVASRFGVSQMIVREAFKQLIIEGFLASEPRRGVSVTMMTADDANELVQLRILLEGQALRWSIPLMSDRDLERASSLISQIDSATSIDMALALHTRFHATLYAPAKRDRTESLIANLAILFERYIRFVVQKSDHFQQAQREHRQLVELCRQRNSDAAVKLLREHISGTGELVVGSLAATTRL